MIQQDLFAPRSGTRAVVDGLVVDLFCGGGGASEGLRRAIGRHPDFAVNHSVEAIAIHEANHPTTIHFRGDVWDASPRDVVNGRRVSILHLSPTCTHFSRAKGGPLKDAKIRSLPWVALRWLREVGPDMFTLENVVEAKTWGRLMSDGRVDPRYVGHTFKTWLGKIRAQGYHVEMRELRGCDFGAPTTRKRLFIVGRRDGNPIWWPAPTHGPGLLPFKTAASCIDWRIQGKSIFSRSKSLAKPTLRRIARALHVHVLSGSPYIIPGTSDVGAMVQTGYGEREGQRPRALDLNAPLGTVVAGASKHAVVTIQLAAIVKNFGGNGNGGPGVGMNEPLSTITTQDHHSLVVATLVQYNGTSNERDIQSPLGTITTRDRFGLVETTMAALPSRGRPAVVARGPATRALEAAMVHRVDRAAGVPWARRQAIRVLLALGDGDGNSDVSDIVKINGRHYVIVDIRLRMLTPRELATAQGFDPAYVLDPIVNGKPLSKTAQVRAIGNSVCPQIVEAIIRANLPTAERRAA